MCEVHRCVSCGNEVDFWNAERVTVAHRKANGEGGSALVCPTCAAEMHSKGARNRIERGAENVPQLDYRITFYCDYGMRAKTELCGSRSQWLPCEGAIKSPLLHNMKWQRRLETVDALINEGELEMTAPVSITVLSEGVVLEHEKVPYNGKADFLTVIRDLVEHHKALRYLEVYGNTYGYRL